MIDYFDTCSAFQQPASDNGHCLSSGNVNHVTAPMMRKLCTPSTVTNHNPLYNTTNPDPSVTELSTNQTTAADDDDDVTTNPDVRASFESLTSGCVSIGSLGDSLPEVKSYVSDRERGENLTSHKLCSHDQDSLLYEGVEFKAFDTWEEHTGDGLLDDVMKCVTNNRASCEKASTPEKKSLIYADLDLNEDDADESNAVRS